MNYNHYDDLIVAVRNYIDKHVDFSAWQGDRDGLEDCLNLTLFFNRKFLNSMRCGKITTRYMLPDVISTVLDYYDI